MSNSLEEKDLVGIRSKIPFLFTPLPHFLFQSDYFRDENAFRLIAWMFHRTAFESRTFSMNAQIVTLAPGEFLFGRTRCSIETGISEQCIRTIINRLINQQNISKVTIKSTNKITVYRWLYDNFPNSSNHQNNPKSTIKTPPTNHKQEYENKEIEKAAAAPLIKKMPEYSSDLVLADGAKKMLRALPIDEQNAILTLFGQRGKNKPIANPGGWIVQCIKHGWHKAKEMAVISIPNETKVNHIEVNRRTAQRIVEHLKGIEHIQVHLRMDILEFGEAGSRLQQIFYHEPTASFNKQILRMLRQLDAIDDSILECLSTSSTVPLPYP